jgi:hypothetical protein
MLSILIAAVLAAVPPERSEEPTRLAAPGLTSVRLDDKLKTF